jgi:serine/threonine-protein kinase PRP4
MVSSVSTILTISRQDAPGAPVIEEPEPEPLDEAALIEERRRRREAIKAKYKATGTPLLVQALQLGGHSGSSTPALNADSNTASAGPGLSHVPSCGNLLT